MSQDETLLGYIDSTDDALLVFEACRRGLLRRIRQRLSDLARSQIRSGSIFVFDERESNIRRWTDGKLWSPSRILGNFLIYREVERKEPPKKLEDLASASAIRGTLTRDIEEGTVDGPLNSQKGTYYFKPNGLIKKTISVTVNGSLQHLICYYSRQDIDQHRVPRVSTNPLLTSLSVSSDIMLHQNFRKSHADLSTRRHAPYRRLSDASSTSQQSSGHYQHSTTGSFTPSPIDTDLKSPAFSFHQPPAAIIPPLVSSAETNAVLSLASLLQHHVTRPPPRPSALDMSVPRLPAPVPSILTRRPPSISIFPPVRSAVDGGPVILSPLNEANVLRLSVSAPGDQDQAVSQRSSITLKDLIHDAEPSSSTSSSTLYVEQTQAHQKMQRDLQHLNSAFDSCNK